jgi:hypothetical protein
MPDLTRLHQLTENLIQCIKDIEDSLSEVQYVINQIFETQYLNNNNLPQNINAMKIVGNASQEANFNLSLISQLDRVKNIELNDVNETAQLMEELTQRVNHVYLTLNDLISETFPEGTIERHRVALLPELTKLTDLFANYDEQTEEIKKCIDEFKDTQEDKVQEPSTPKVHPAAELQKRFHQFMEEKEEKLDKDSSAQPPPTPRR